jgi:3-deoxy-D-manno-octulosonate 8-phosphate phosphatase (KDO 8-P phosphatase)
MSIKALVMDVDGTLTDGKIYMSPSGEAMKAFNIKDGFGIHNILPLHNIMPVIITGRSSVIVKNRCDELGITAVYQGVDDKFELLKTLFPDLSMVAYIGDDINDLKCMKEIKDAGGIVGCPADAVKEVECISDYVTEHEGGNGAVRDFIEWIIKDD